MIMTLRPPSHAVSLPAMQRLATVAAWLVMLAILALFAWNLLSNPQPGPYGTCYGSRGQAVPCSVPKPK